MTIPAIKVDALGKRYRINVREKPHGFWDAFRAPFGYLRSALREPSPEEILWALKDVSFEVERGGVLGIIGANGAGKSTLLKVLARITEPTEGRAEIRGRVGSLLEVGTGFHPQLSGRENIYLSGAILGMRKAEIARKFDEIVAFAGVEKFIDMPVKRYSSGMYVRLAFAVAAHLEPEVLLVDEVLAVGDAAFQKKCLGRMSEVAREGRTVLFVSHNMAAITRLCHRAILLEGGSITAQGEPDDVVENYLTRSRGDAGRVQVKNQESETATIREVGLVNSTGQFCRSTAVDKAFCIWIKCEIKKTIRKAQIALAVLASDGTVVFCSTHSDKIPVRDAILTKGTYRIKVHMPGHFLNTGEYVINVRVWGTVGAESRTAHANAMHVFTFRVEETGSVAARLRDKRRGVVIPLLDWEFIEQG